MWCTARCCAFESHPLRHAVANEIVRDGFFLVFVPAYTAHREFRLRGPAMLVRAKFAPARAFSAGRGRRAVSHRDPFSLYIYHFYPMISLIRSRFGLFSDDFEKGADCFENLSILRRTDSGRLPILQRLRQNDRTGADQSRRGRAKN